MTIINILFTVMFALLAFLWWVHTQIIARQQKQIDTLGMELGRLINEVERLND